MKASDIVNLQNLFLSTSIALRKYQILVIFLIFNWFTKLCSSGRLQKIQDNDSVNFTQFPRFEHIIEKIERKNYIRNHLININYDIGWATYWIIC